MLTSEKVERIYTSYSSIYDLLFNTILQPGRERAVLALGVAPGDRVLEVGVGTGLSLPYYPAHCEIVGIDISSAMLEKAEARSRELGLRGTSFQRMEAEKMTFPDASFDRVVASYVMSAVPDPLRVAKELWRVCKPGGTIILLNHFRSRNPVIAMGEKALTPLSRKFGFVLDLGLDNLVDDGRFDLKGIEKVNIPPFWSLVRLARNGKPAHA